MIGLDVRTGRIAAWNRFKGYGFAQCGATSVFMHHTALCSHVQGAWGDSGASWHPATWQAEVGQTVHLITEPTDRGLAAAFAGCEACLAIKKALALEMAVRTGGPELEQQLAEVVGEGVRIDVGTTFPYFFSMTLPASVANDGVPRVFREAAFRALLEGHSKENVLGLARKAVADAVAMQKARPQVATKA